MYPFSFLFMAGGVAWAWPREFVVSNIGWKLSHKKETSFKYPYCSNVADVVISCRSNSAVLKLWKHH